MYFRVISTLLSLVMNRSEFQRISRIRKKEARILLSNKEYAGAYYLIGYSIECALKACIAKQIQKWDFPDKEITNKVFTHNLESLLKLAGLEQQLKKDMDTNPSLKTNWAVIKDWSESSRYKTNITQKDATSIYSSCNSRKDGILPWIKKKW